MIQGMFKNTAQTQALQSFWPINHLIETQAKCHRFQNWQPNIFQILIKGITENKGTQIGESHMVQWLVEHISKLQVL